MRAGAKVRAWDARGGLQDSFCNRRRFDSRLNKRAKRLWCVRPSQPLWLDETQFIGRIVPAGNTTGRTTVQVDLEVAQYALFQRAGRSDMAWSYGESVSQNFIIPQSFS